MIVPCGNCETCVEQSKIHGYCVSTVAAKILKWKLVWLGNDTI